MLPLPDGGAPQLLFLAALAALVGGLAAVERKGALQLMLARPLVLGAVMGWALGDARAGLMLGVPLELLFLGGVNLGGNLPDNESLLTAALTAMVIPAGLETRLGADPPLAAMGLALLFPLAVFGRRLERAAEGRNDELLAEAMARAGKGDPAAARVNLRGLWLPFAAAAAISAACVFLSPVLAWVRIACTTGILSGWEGAWHAVWAVAAACSIRAIRESRAAVVAAVSAAAVIALGLAVRGLL